MTAIAVVPIAVWAIATGFGLLAESILRLAVPKALLAPVGFCLSIVVCLAIYSLGAGNPVAVPVVCVLAGLGYLLGRRGLASRVLAGWPLLAGIGVYLIFTASVIVTGHWTFTGYNVTNDPAYEMLLVSHLQGHGIHGAVTGTSTANTVVSSYLRTAYPLGSQSLLAVISGLLRVAPAVIWQGFISAMAGIAAIAATTLSGRTMGTRAAALTAGIAIAAALTYQYALAGYIKEIAVLATLMCALAAIREAVLHMRGGRALALTAIPLAGLLAVYGAASVPYVLALACAGAVAFVAVHRTWPERAWIRPLLVGGVAFVVCSIPTLIMLHQSLQVLSSGFSGSMPGAPLLGPLHRPLPVSEMSGVWLGGDYSSPITDPTRSLITMIATAALVVLLVPAIWRLVSVREPGPLMALLVIILIQLLLYPRVTPYARGKLLAIDSPVVVLCALQGLTFARRRSLHVGLAAVGAGLGAVVLGSDAIAYHAVPVAPTTRLLALRQVGQVLGARGPVLDSEFEQYAKVFTRPALLIDGPDAPTPEALDLRDPSLVQYANSFDLDQEKLSFVESFPYVLTRRGPATSRPPSNFKMIMRNGFYELWSRQSTMRVDRHLSEGGALSAAGRVECHALGRLVADPPVGSSLSVAERAPARGFHVLEVRPRPFGWFPDPNVPGAVMTRTPGTATHRIRVQSGPYSIWVQGSLPRPVSVLVDGRRVGSAQGENTRAAWLNAGTVLLSRGRHTLGVQRGGNTLLPGDGDVGAWLGAAVVVPTTLERVVHLPLRRWRSLCGREADWVEVIS